jgi:hypothetical protein
MDSVQNDLKGSRIQKCSFSFIKAEEYDTEKPYYYSGPLAPDNERLRTNLRYSTVDGIEIVDVRGVRDHLSIDKQGFEYIDVPPSLKDDALSENGLDVYLKEVTSFLRFRLKAQLVLAYDYRVRMKFSFNSLTYTGNPVSLIRE